MDNSPRTLKNCAKSTIVAVTLTEGGKSLPQKIWGKNHKFSTQFLRLAFVLCKNFKNACQYFLAFAIRSSLLPWLRTSALSKFNIFNSFLNWRKSFLLNAFLMSTRKDFATDALDFGGFIEFFSPLDGSRVRLEALLGARSLANLLFMLFLANQHGHLCCRFSFLLSTYFQYFGQKISAESVSPGSFNGELSLFSCTD